MKTVAQPLCTLGTPGQWPTIATLGDPLASTCSIDLAMQWLGEGRGRILGFASFEEAGDAVVSGLADLLLVPAAYPKMGRFIFDPQLATYEPFTGDLPPMVLVEAPEPAVPRIDKLYYHPALIKLAEQIEAQSGKPYQRVEVVSNAVACQEVLRDPAAWALTNAVAAERYAVHTLATLREDWQMPTALFKARDPEPGDDLTPFLGGGTKVRHSDALKGS
jgi:hypothetical protein